MEKKSFFNSPERDVYVKKMFSSIAKSYDFLNRTLSFGRDRYWRRFTVLKLCDLHDGVVLDVATGTGDMPLELLKRCRGVKRVIGIDISKEMLRLAKKKVEENGCQEKIGFYLNDAYLLSFTDEGFDAALISFGIRNMSDKLRGLKEVYRVIKKGGRVVILEFSRPNSFLVKWFYSLYSLKILPIIGGFVSRVKHAYQYLPQSILEFPDSEEFVGLMKKAGFKDIRYDILTFGVVTVYVGIK